MIKEQKNIKFGFGQWGKKSNSEAIYYGCFNNCRYCGVAITQCDWLNKRKREDWNLMVLNKQAYNKRIRKRTERSIFPTSHDMFWFNKKMCFNFLKKLINPKKLVFNDVLIISKPRYDVIKYLCEKFEEMEHFEKVKKAIQFRFTITTQNEGLIRFWEGNSPLFPERKKALKYTSDNEWDNSVVLEPYLDPPEKLIALVDVLTPITVGSIWVGHMNRIKKKGLLKEEEPYYRDIRKNCSHRQLTHIIRSLKDNRKIKYKGSIVKKINLIPDYQVPKFKVKESTTQNLLQSIDHNNDLRKI
jgi:DNA repair photolyase